MYNQFIILCVQTIILWSLVVLLHRQKARITLIPLYSFIAILTILTHNLSDLGFAIVINEWYFLISSFSFFTALMLAVFFIYLFEGPKATRLALFVILFTSFLYILVVFLLGLQADTSKWIILSSKNFVIYFWSILAIIIDIFLMTIFWELLTKINKMPILIKVFLVIFGTFLVDTLIFVTGVFGNQVVYLSVLKANLIIRLILSLIITPFIILYLKNKKYDEDEREKPKKFWDILNFNSNLESKIITMEEMIENQKILENEVRESEERYSLALEGVNAGIWDWNVTDDKIFYSPKFYSLIGLEKEEIGNNLNSFKSILHPDDIEKTFSMVDKSLNNMSKYSTEFRLRTKDGTYKWFLSSGITKFDSFGKAIRMVGSIIDINDKKIIDQSYKEKVNELEKFNKLMINRELKMNDLKEEIEKLKKG